MPKDLLKGKTVLIVDDEPDILQTLEGAPLPVSPGVSTIPLLPPLFCSRFPSEDTVSDGLPRHKAIPGQRDLSLTCAILTEPQRISWPS